MRKDQVIYQLNELFSSNEQSKKHLTEQAIEDRQELLEMEKKSEALLLAIKTLSKICEDGKKGKDKKTKMPLLHRSHT